jgi:AraC-like DNA-binding protein
MPALIHKIDWLFDEGLPASEWSGSLKRMPYPYPPDIANGYAEHIEFHDGITLVKNFHFFVGEDRPPEIPLASFIVEPATPCFVAHMMHSGSIHAVNDKNNHHHQRVVGVDILGRAASIHATQTLLTEEDISLSMLFIPEIQLINLMGSEATDSLFSNLGILQIADYKEIKVPLTISNKIANCTPSNLSGSMRHLFASSIILQYLMEVSIFASTSKSFLNNLEKNDLEVDALHADLLKITMDIPKLSDLAKKYNVTAAKLNQSFQKKYDQSIYSFLSNQRLDQAHQALLASDIPMKTLAHKIGYSHVNHFITAFKKKFGVTPGSLKRRSE